MILFSSISTIRDNWKTHTDYRHTNANYKLSNYSMLRIQFRKIDDDLSNQMGVFSYENRIMQKIKISHADITNEEWNTMVTWPYDKWKQ